MHRDKSIDKTEIVKNPRRAEMNMLGGEQHNFIEVQDRNLKAPRGN